MVQWADARILTSSTVEEWVFAISLCKNKSCMIAVIDGAQSGPGVCYDKYTERYIGFSFALFLQGTIIEKEFFDRLVDVVDPVCPFNIDLESLSDLQFFDANELRKSLETDLGARFFAEKTKAVDFFKSFMSDIRLDRNN